MINKLVSILAAGGENAIEKFKYEIGASFIADQLSEAGMPSKDAIGSLAYLAKTFGLFRASEHKHGKDLAFEDTEDVKKEVEETVLLIKKHLVKGKEYDNKNAYVMMAAMLEVAYDMIRVVDKIEDVRCNGDCENCECASDKEETKTTNESSNNPLDELINILTKAKESGKELDIKAFKL